MYENPNIEVIARGICIKNGKILLCHAKNSKLTYLPGGHIEFNETARIALEREIKEEMGIVAHASKFIGCIEHSFIQKNEPHCEINLIFQMELPEIDDTQTPSNEDWIGFKWVELKDLPKANLKPESIVENLQKWLENPGHCEDGNYN